MPQRALISGLGMGWFLRMALKAAACFTIQSMILMMRFFLLEVAIGFNWSKVFSSKYFFYFKV
jgi:hypothetical protein